MSNRGNVKPLVWTRQHWFQMGEASYLIASGSGYRYVIVQDEQWFRLYVEPARYILFDSVLDAMRGANDHYAAWVRG